MSFSIPMRLYPSLRFFLHLSFLSVSACLSFLLRFFLLPSLPVSLQMTTDLFFRSITDPIVQATHKWKWILLELGHKNTETIFGLERETSSSLSVQTEPVSMWLSLYTSNHMVRWLASHNLQSPETIAVLTAKSIQSEYVRKITRTAIICSMIFFEGELHPVRSKTLMLFIFSMQ